MDKEELLQIIDKAAKDGLTELDLSNKEIIELPPEIGRLTTLRSLNLNYNQLTLLPAETGNLTELKSLRLSRNQLTEWPPEIGNLTGLQSLNLGYNGISELPPEIGNLTGLRSLDLRQNYLTKLPTEISSLTELQWLNLRENKLTEWPTEIRNYTELQSLNLSLNQLVKLPPEIGNLILLKSLRLTHNHFTKLPPEIGNLLALKSLRLTQNKLTELPPEIGNLTELKSLHLGYNRLTELPPEIWNLTKLETLYLYGNHISELPPEIRILKKISNLNLKGNALSIPPEILGKTNKPATIINYYFKHVGVEKRPLNEAKMILVGQGSVGKTSLVKRLIRDEFDPDENKTEGISIDKWWISVDGDEIRLNVWDFGGQEIMHATHQFFLTKRSIYLLVLDARIGEDENRVEYWLKIIQSFGGDSPIIVVGNKIDQQPLDIDRRGLQAKYPQIKAFVETCCESGKGIEELKKVIAKEVGQIDHIHDELAVTWFAVKTHLEEMTDDFISFKDYLEICKKENITDEISPKTLAGFMHDLGIVLNFHDDPRLYDTNILNPEWVTNGVYKILNSHALFESKGVLERAQLNEILDIEIYPEDKHLFIIDMMRKFELCFDFEGTKDEKFLIPDLLSKEEAYTGEWKDPLAFQFHYNVLPGSIISRFIVRMHPYIHKNTCWRNGVLLEHEKNIALVKADTEEKTIYIRVKGHEDKRRLFLAIIRAEFDLIHKTIPRIDAKEKVPLPDEPDIVIDYEHLLNLESMGESSFVPPGLKERISVQQLLNGIEDEQTRRERREKKEGHRMDDDYQRKEAISPSVESPGKITPITFIREAIKAVPATKYALGIGGIVSVISVVGSFGLDLKVAGFGAIVMLVLMAILVIFARMTGLVRDSLKIPALIFTWFTLILFMATSTFLCTSIFFKWPVNLAHWLTGGGGTG
ncbi:MAG: COR domain-containing protein [candidate division Zixibacteria bacterium]